MIISKYYAFCCRVKQKEIKMSDIDNIYPIKIITHANTFKSSLYKIGIVYEGHKTFFIGKSHLENGIINDVKKMRFYVYGKYESFEDIQRKLVKSNIEMV